MTIALVQPVDDAVRRIIAIVDQIIAISGRENAALSRGFPPDLAATTARKRELATEFDLWLAFLRQEHLLLDDADPALRLALEERVRQMHACVAENLVRLEAAIEARASRIEAVMRAVRAELRPAGGTYGASGRVEAGRMRAVAGLNA